MSVFSFVFMRQVESGAGPTTLAPTYALVQQDMRAWRRMEQHSLIVMSNVSDHSLHVCCVTRDAYLNNCSLQLLMKFRRRSSTTSRFSR